jgi:hypothetical protein
MAFASLRESDQLAWRQASMFARAIEVTSRDSLAGILRFQGWGIQCDATCADGMWVFRRHGFFWRNVTAEESGAGRIVGEVTMRFTRGTLSLDAGETLGWKQLSFWRGECAFVTPTSEFPVVRFQPRRF